MQAPVADAAPNVTIMAKILSDRQIAAYERDGFVSPIRVMAPDAAAAHRARLEAVESAAGGELAPTLRSKPHLLLPWLSDLVRDGRILDAVEDIIGPNILVWSSSFFTKEAHDPSYVSWHQDSTYWGLSAPDVVTAWIAFSPSTPAAGCMRVIPGTHKRDQVAHTDTHAVKNLLSRGQEIAVEVDESRAVDVVLEPGEISLHHIRLFHGSPPNGSDDRRIGFAIRYVPPYVRQLNGPKDFAMLVRGEDGYGHFELEPSPKADMHPDALALHARVKAAHSQILFQGSNRQPYA